MHRRGALALKGQFIAVLDRCREAIRAEIAGLACGPERRSAFAVAAAFSIAAADKDRRALVEKGAHAFGMVRGFGSLDLQVAFEIELVGEVVLTAFIERLLDQP